jgi:DNA invertase Pin-like site-specific DNA recombinase
MQTKTFYYARVSSNSQNLARQIEAFKADGANDRDIITEKQSCKNMNHPAYQALKTQMLRPGDTLVVKSLDRLGRNKAQIKDELEYYRKNHIRVRILDLPTTNIKAAPGQEAVVDLVNNLLIEVLSYMAEQERINIRQRQAEGIAIAKAQGKYKERQPKRLDDSKFKTLYEQYRTRQISKTEMAKQLNISRTTLNRHLRSLGLMKVL